MMPVVQMRAIEDDLEAGRLPEVVREAAARWGAMGRVRRFRTSDSFVFKIATDTGPLALRMHDARHRHLDRITATQDLAAHLVASGVAVARPIPSLGGCLVETLHSSDATYHVGCQQWLDGPRADAVEHTPAFFHSWGTLLAHMHQSLRALDPTISRQLGDWLDHLESRLEFIANDTDVMTIAVKTINCLRSFTNNDTAYGVCHGDAQIDNIIIVADVPYLIDFDLASSYWFAGDIIMAAEDTFNPSDVDGTEAKAFFAGYGKVPEGLELAETFQALIAVDGLETLAAAYAGSDPEDDPAWLAEMRDRHQSEQALLRHALLRSGAGR